MHNKPHQWIICLIILLPALLSAGCGQLQQTSLDSGIMTPRGIPPEAAHPAEGDLFLSDNTPADIESFLLRARSADYMLLGEGHTSPCDHHTQAVLIQALDDAGLKPALGLEMVAVDKQEVLDTFNSGQLSAAELEDALDWSHRWGHSFDLYLPIFELAESRGIQLFALNVPNTIIRAVSAEGLDNLPEEQRALLPETIIPPRDDQKVLLKEEFERHLAMFEDKELPEQEIQSRLERFFLIQSLWDTAMAREATRVRKVTNQPVVVLAGSGHVEYGWGLAHRITTLDPGSLPLLVVPWRGKGAVDPEAGDIFYFCPLTERARLGLLLEWKETGALVLEVIPGSRAEAGGVLAGDVILKAMDMKLDGLFTLHKAGRQAAEKNTPLQITILRDSETLDLEISLPSEDSTGKM